MTGAPDGGWVHFKVNEDADGVVTACGPPLPAPAPLLTTIIPARTTCPQCRRNPCYNWSLPFALRGEARPFA